jgi:transmembrane protein
MKALAEPKTPHYDSNMNKFVSAILENGFAALVARIVLTFVFWSAGLAGLLDFANRVEEMRFFGLEPAPVFAVLTSLWLLLGSALIILNRGAWLGAGALAVFTVITIPIAHHFWDMSEPQRTGEFHMVMEHITVIGGLAVAAMLCHGRRRDRI